MSEQGPPRIRHIDKRLARRWTRRLGDCGQESTSRQGRRESSCGTHEVTSVYCSEVTHTLLRSGGAAPPPGRQHERQRERQHKATRCLRDLQQEKSPVRFLTAGAVRVEVPVAGDPARVAHRVCVAQKPAARGVDQCNGSKNLDHLIVCRSAVGGTSGVVTRQRRRSTRRRAAGLQTQRLAQDLLPCSCECSVGLSWICWG